MKKICTILTILVVIALCLFLLPTKSQAEEIPGNGSFGEGFTFAYVNGLLIIYGSGPMPDFSYTDKAPWDVANSPIKEIAIKEGITSIGNFSFSSCYQLEKIYLPTTLTSIGESAFAGSNLSSLVLPTNVESIGASAFAYCGNLSTVTFNANLKSIGQSAFYSCPILKTITIPASVTSIETSAFASCTSLTKIQVDNNNAVYASDASGVLFDKGMATLMQMPGSFSGAYTIPDTVTAISDRAFYACSGLTALSIPDSVTAIGDAAFKFCNGLTYQEHDNAKYLGNSQNPYMVLVSATTQAAAECSVSTDTKFICDRAFEKCTELKSITIPDSVIYIGAGAFSRCSALTNVTIGNSVSQIKNATFMDCNALETVILGSKVELIDEQAFYACYALKSINLPRGLTTIGRMAFAGCMNLPSVILPAGITTIDLDAFAYCQNLTGVTFCGTESQWEKYKVGFYSTPLENIQVTYHAPEEATCTRASTCRLCGETFGDPLGHTPGDEPTETTAQTCTVCGEELAPALNTATLPSTQATVPSTPQTTPDVENNSDEEKTDNSAVIWIIIGTLVIAGGTGAGVFLFKKHKLVKPQEAQEPQE